MDKSYQIIRVNKNEMTLTVMLKYGDKTLQQDVPVDNFTDMPVIEASIQAHLDKLETDMKAIQGKEDLPVDPSIQAMVDQYTTTEVNPPVES